MTTLRHLRENLGLMQKDMAATLGIPGSTFCRYDKGDREIPQDIIIRIFKTYGIYVDPQTKPPRPRKQKSPPEEPKGLSIAELRSASTTDLYIYARNNREYIRLLLLKLYAVLSEPTLEDSHDGVIL